MHFHGVHYKPQLRRRARARHLGPRRRRQAGSDLDLQAHRRGSDSVGIWPYHDHSPSMDDSIVGRMYGALSRSSGAREQRPDRRVRGRLRPDGRLPDHRRARLRRQHAGLRLDRRADRPRGRDGHGLQAPTFQDLWHRWRSPFTDQRRHRRPSGPADTFRSAGRRIRDVALPLPRGDPHDGGHDPGTYHVKRRWGGSRSPAPPCSPRRAGRVGRRWSHDERRRGSQVAATVSILVAAFGPPHTDVLVGDTCALDEHQRPCAHREPPTAAPGRRAFLPGDAFTHRFDTVSVATYYCVLHPFMRGDVDVHHVLLEVPTKPGAPVTRSPSTALVRVGGGTDVSIEVDTGAGFLPAGHATVDADGTFTTPRSNRRRPPPTARWWAPSPARRSSCSCSTAGVGDRGRPGPRRRRLRASPGVVGGAASSCACSCPSTSAGGRVRPR